MSDVPGIRATAEAREYLNDIVSEMVTLFSISRDEATGRVAEFWAGQVFLSDEALIALFHMPAEHWAKRIYYDCTRWWDNEGSLRPAPYPRRSRGQST
jgi:hypothetical protein